jgi:DNA-binding XRE family transcriptional regulator
LDEGENVDQLERKQLLIKMADNLPVLRTKLGLTQDELAKLVGVSRSTVILFERKQRQMTWNTFLSFILVFSKNSETNKLLSALEIYTEKLNEILDVK